MKSKVKNVLLISVALVIVALGALCYTGYNMSFDKYYGEDVRIYIPENATSSDIRDSLVSRLGDYGKNVYKTWSLQRAVPSMAHGSYVISRGDNALNVSRALRSGHQTPVRLSFNNIRTVDELAQRLATKMEWSADDFLAACDSILSEKGFKPAQYAAAFLPDTYEFYWTNSAENVVKRLSDFRDKFWNDERRAKAADLGLKPVEVSIIASIVEEETAKSDERGKVARLYLNRLSKGMLLQADPTVKFAIGDFSIRRIFNRHLSIDSPYNTYKYAGLPPGPIRIAERRTLEAVLGCPEHDYLYMCAKEDFSGYHNFAEDYATHQANARRYQRELNRRGIK